MKKMKVKTPNIARKRAMADERAAAGIIFAKNNSSPPKAIQKGPYEPNNFSSSSASF
jgi:hypothetical protein